MKPKILPYTKVVELQEINPDLNVRSDVEFYIDELYDIYHPENKDSKTEQDINSFITEYLGMELNEWGSWVHYPWLNQCYHIPPKKEFRMLRTSRNRNLITSEEQAKLYDSTIFIAGMSVGSNVVEAMISQGIGGTFILADMDIIEPSNLNRIRSPLHHVGLHKVEAISRKVWEIDPYIEIISLENGISREILEDTLSHHKVDVLVDEIDSLDMKIAIREQAKKRKLPVIMAADDGDDALIDIERYDTKPEMQLFDGQIPENILEKIREGSLSRKETGMLIGRYFVGANHVPLRMFESLVEVGKSLPSWPQLGGAAALSGISLAYAAKKILLNLPLNDGRTLISLDEKLTKLSDSDKHKLVQFKQMMFGDDNG